MKIHAARCVHIQMSLNDVPDLRRQDVPWTAPDQLRGDASPVSDTIGIDAALSDEP